MGHHFSDIDQWKSTDLQTYPSIVIAFGYPLVLDNKIIEDTTHLNHATLEIKWVLHLYRIAFMVPEDTNPVKL